MRISRVVVVAVLVCASAALARAVVTRAGVGPFEYLTGALIVLLLLRTALAVVRRERRT
jgi:hypothetical protein